MNKALLLTLCFAMTPSAFAETVRLSEPVQETDQFEVFGSPMPDTSTGMSLGALLEKESEFDGQDVRVTTKVGKVCQKKGCFFVAYDGDRSARISFADYSFFVPTDSGGKEVTLVGTFSRKAISQEQAEHFAQDMGEDAASAKASDFEYSIVATSVLIPRS